MRVVCRYMFHLMMITVDHFLIQTLKITKVGLYLCRRYSFEFKACVKNQSQKKQHIWFFSNIQANTKKTKELDPNHPQYNREYLHYWTM